MQSDISERACLCLAMKQKESKILSQFLWTGATHPKPRPSASAQAADSLPWCLRHHPCVEVAFLCPDWILRHCAMGAQPRHSAGEQPSRYQHTPLGTLSSPLESPQDWGAAHPQAGSNLGTGLGSRRIWGRVAHYKTVHQQRQPSSLLALENALQHPNPAVLQARADGPANCQYATASAPCVVLQRAIVMAASNEENWCVFVLLPFK